MSKPALNVILAKPRGFCAGVERAIEIVLRAIEIYGPPVYVRHEIVHNKRVVETLRGKGAVFVEELDEVPEGSVTVFSAHGVAEAIESEAKRRGLPVIDATCPLVLKVHLQGQRQAQSGREIILIGHRGHPEVEGTIGRMPNGARLVTSVKDAEEIEIGNPDSIAYVTQTTLSVDETREIIATLKRRFPNIVGPDVKDICYATQHRQNAVRELAEVVEALIVVGARNSSNSTRLREIGSHCGVPSYQIDDAGDVDPAWFEGVTTVGVTAGASAPEELIRELLDKLSSFREITVVEMKGVEEGIQFKLPHVLRRDQDVARPATSQES